MNYQIITDEEKLKEFIDWLPDLKPTEKYYLCLFARSKYTKDENGVNGIAHIKSDKAQLKRFVSDKTRMFQKIKQLEVEIGAYTQKDISIPQQALAVYITTNPRDMWKATTNSMVKLAHCIRDQNVLVNPHQEVLSEIQKTKGTTHYVDFDIDVDSKTRGKEICIQIWQYLDIGITEAATFLETRGGFHVLVDPKKVPERLKNKWHQYIKSLPHIDQTGDQMIPVPGTHQGGFTPRFIKF